VKIDVKLFFQGFSDVDFRQDSDPFLPQSGGDSFQGLGEGDLQGCG
jgi:hypothetical protein